MVARRIGGADERAMKQKGTKLQVRRGQEVWSYIYVALTVALTIESAVVAITPASFFPWNLLSLIVIAPTTIWLFLDNRWLHQRLVNLKLMFENKGR